MRTYFCDAVNRPLILQITQKQKTIKLEHKATQYLPVPHQPYTIDTDGTTTMVEEATAAKPFIFISGFGINLDKFEDAIVGLSKGDEFDFRLTSSEAYGDYAEERVIDLDKAMFYINGRFDNDNVYKDAFIQLQNHEGQYFMARVLDITADKVKMDLNHPFAGKELNFKGSVVERREATNEEIQMLIHRLSGEAGWVGCFCNCAGGHKEGGCGHHDGGCGDHHEGGCGGHHEGGCSHHEGGCGHRH